MYTEIELKAMDEADRAFAEVRKVAEEFARQIGCEYKRKVTDWASFSTFNPPMFNHKSKEWGQVKELYKGDNGDALDCSWEIEREWNMGIKALLAAKNAYLDALVAAETDHEHDYFDGKLDECYDAKRYLLEKIAETIERWYESASDFAYESYLEDHAA